MEFFPEILQNYADSHTSQEPDYLQELNRETWLKVLQPRMLSGHYQGRALSMLSKLVSPSRILEIGTYTGYSALCLAEGLREDGTLVTLEVNGELEDMCKRYFAKSPYEPQIDMRIGQALDLIPAVEGPIDLVFIDADKENYINYYKLILPKMRRGGIILADNVLWSGRVTDENEDERETVGLREFSKFVQADDSVENLLLTLRDGLMVIRKK